MGAELRALTGNWSTFEDALSTYKAGDYDGLMFAITPDDPYVFIDLDQCRNPKNRILNKDSKRIVGQFDSFTEVSLSGKGVHTLIKGKNRVRDEDKERSSATAKSDSSQSPGVYSRVATRFKIVRLNLKRSIRSILSPPIMNLNQGSWPSRSLKKNLIRY